MDQFRPSLSDRDVELDDFEGGGPARESALELRGPSPGKLGRGNRPKVMRKATGLASTPAASRYVDAAARSNGAALPGDLRGRLESSLGADLGGVRVHTGGDSVRAAQSVAAKAYTVGQDIHFGAGHYDPGSIEGQRLIAHEVAHTVQQIGGAGSVQTKLEVSAPGDAHEVEADRFADAFVSGAKTQVSRGSVGAGIHRKKDDVHRHDDEEALWPGSDAEELTGFLGLEDPTSVRETVYRGYVRIRGSASAVAHALADLEALSETSVGSKLLSELEKAAADDKGYLEVFVVDHGKGFPTSAGANPAFAGTRRPEQGQESSVKVGRSRRHPKTGRPIGRPYNQDGSLKVAGPGTPVAIQDIRVAYDTTVMDRYGAGGPSFVALAHELIHALGLATGGTYPTTMVDTASGTNHEELRTTGLGPYAKNEMSENALRREIGMEERDRYSSVTGPKGRTSPPPGIGQPKVAKCDIVPDGDGWFVSGTCNVTPPPDSQLSVALRVLRGEQSILGYFAGGLDPKFQFRVEREQLARFLQGTQKVVFEIEPSLSSSHWKAAGEIWRSKPFAVVLAPVQRKASGGAKGASASADVDAAARSTGAALPGDLRGRLESSLGADLGGVRVHTGGDSVRAAQSVAAKAYTVGQDIHFGAGHYDPGSVEGQRLIAHEVAHTVQQLGGGGSVQTKLEVSAPGDAHEVEADRFADAFVSGSRTQVSRGSVGAGIHRKAVVVDDDGFDPGEEQTDLFDLNEEKSGGGDSYGGGQEDPGERTWKDKLAGAAVVAIDWFMDTVNDITTDDSSVDSTVGHWVTEQHMALVKVSEKKLQELSPAQFKKLKAMSPYRDGEIDRGPDMEGVSADSTIATWSKDDGKEPTFGNDSIYKQGWKDRPPGLKDLQRLLKWDALLSAAMAAAPQLEDATKAYHHFLYGGGDPFTFDFGEFIAEDRGGREAYATAVRETTRGAVKWHDDHPGESKDGSSAFDIECKPFLVSAQDENWTKAVGNFQMWITAHVVVTKVGDKRHFAVAMRLHGYDFYNFNPGAGDVATGARDSINAELVVAGVGDEFDQHGTSDHRFEFDATMAPAEEQYVPTEKNVEFDSKTGRAVDNKKTALGDVVVSKVETPAKVKKSGEDVPVTITVHSKTARDAVLKVKWDLGPYTSVDPADLPVSLVAGENRIETQVVSTSENFKIVVTDAESGYGAASKQVAVPGGGRADEAPKDLTPPEFKKVSIREKDGVWTLKGSCKEPSHEGSKFSIGVSVDLGKEYFYWSPDFVDEGVSHFELDEFAGTFSLVWTPAQSSLAPGKYDATFDVNVSYWNLGGATFTEKHTVVVPPKKAKKK